MMFNKKKRFFQVFFVNGTGAKVEVTQQFDVNNKQDLGSAELGEHKLILVKGADGDVRHYFLEKITMFKVIEE